MLSTPWRSCRATDPKREYLALLSFLPLKRLWRVPSFLIYTIRITRQLQRSPGLMGYSLQTELLTGRFRTLSVWENEAALQAFVQAAPHQETMRALIPHMGPTRFVRWTVLGAHLPVRWDEALRR
jgi:quinol monooxygenase YgiN